MKPWKERFELSMHSTLYLPVRTGSRRIGLTTETMPDYSSASLKSLTDFRAVLAKAVHVCSISFEFEDCKLGLFLTHPTDPLGRHCYPAMRGFF